ncbi:hypothetical protein [Escherichia coli]|nr:hypothetical protein [Escherichia coli]
MGCDGFYFRCNHIRRFLMLVPGKMLFCSFCVMLMKQVRKIASVE